MNCCSPSKRQLAHSRDSQGIIRPLLPDPTCHGCNRPANAHGIMLRVARGDCCPFTLQQKGQEHS